LTRLTVVTVPASSVLVRDGPPAPVRPRTVRRNTERNLRVDALVCDGAQVGPVIAEVEDIDKLMPGGQRAQPNGFVDARLLGRIVPVSIDEQPALLAEVEHVEVSAVPAGEGVVDGGGELGEGVRPGCCEDTTGPGPQGLTASSDQVDLDRQPSSCHGAILADPARGPSTPSPLVMSESLPRTARWP
jgi:hypothetical protein